MSLIERLAPLGALAVVAVVLALANPGGRGATAHDHSTHDHGSHVHAHGNGAREAECLNNAGFVNVVFDGHPEDGSVGWIAMLLRPDGGGAVDLSLYQLPTRRWARDLVAKPGPARALAVDRYAIFASPRDHRGLGRRLRLVAGCLRA